METEAQFLNSGARKVTLVTIRTPYGLNQLLLPFSEAHAIYSREDACPGCTGNTWEEAQVALNWIHLQLRIFWNFTPTHTLTFSSISDINVPVPPRTNTQLCHLTISWITSIYSFISLWLARLRELSPELGEMPAWQVIAQTWENPTFLTIPLLSPPFCPFLSLPPSFSLFPEGLLHARQYFWCWAYINEQNKYLYSLWEYTVVGRNRLFKIMSKL